MRNQRPYPRCFNHRAKYLTHLFHGYLSADKYFSLMHVTTLGGGEGATKKIITAQSLMLAVVIHGTLDLYYYLAHTQTTHVVGNAPCTRPRRCPPRSFPASGTAACSLCRPPPSASSLALVPQGFDKRQQASSLGATPYLESPQP